jgi:hypothetical protein
MMEMQYRQLSSQRNALAVMYSTSKETEMQPQYYIHNDDDICKDFPFQLLEIGDCHALD